MKKRYLHPIWKIDEIEKELSILEQNGWRLNKIYGIRNFEFVKSKHKSAKYFFTYSIPREKFDMYFIEDSLKQKLNATEISGNLIEFLGITKVYRIINEVEYEEQVHNRNIVLQHYLFKRMIYWILALLLLSTPLIMGLVLNPEKLFNDIISQIFGFLLLAFCFVLAVFGLIHNIIGYVYMKSKNR